MYIECAVEAEAVLMDCNLRGLRQALTSTPPTYNKNTASNSIAALSRWKALKPNNQLQVYLAAGR